MNEFLTFLTENAEPVGIILFVPAFFALVLASGGKNLPLRKNYSPVNEDPLMVFGQNTSKRDRVLGLLISWAANGLVKFSIRENELTIYKNGEPTSDSQIPEYQKKLFSDLFLENNTVKFDTAVDSLQIPHNSFSVSTEFLKVNYPIYLLMMVGFPLGMYLIIEAKMRLLGVVVFGIFGFIFAPLAFFISCKLGRNAKIPIKYYENMNYQFYKVRAGKLSDQEFVAALPVSAASGSLTFSYKKYPNAAQYCQHYFENPENNLNDLGKFAVKEHFKYTKWLIFVIVLMQIIAVICVVTVIK